MSQAPLLTRTGNVTYSSAATSSRHRLTGSLVNPGHNAMPAAAHPVSFCPTPRRSGSFHQPVGYRTPRSTLLVPPAPPSPRAAASAAAVASNRGSGSTSATIDREGGSGGSGARRGTTSPEVIDQDDEEAAMFGGSGGSGEASGTGSGIGSAGTGASASGGGPERRLANRQPSDIQEAEEPLLELW